MFNTEAKFYDQFHQDKNYRKEARMLRKAFPKAKTVFEIGCGTGNLTKELEKLGFKVTCVEPSEEMLKYFKGKTKKVLHRKINDPWFLLWEKKFDLVLALYDVLNYIPENDFVSVFCKIFSMSKNRVIEVWPNKPVKFFTYKKAGDIHRIRLGIQLKERVFLWYIYFGLHEICSETHMLYMHI
jgi:SAM-dependent methyltransferase